MLRSLDAGSFSTQRWSQRSSWKVAMGLGLHAKGFGPHSVAEEQEASVDHIGRRLYVDRKWHLRSSWAAGPP